MAIATRPTVVGMLVRVPAPTKLHLISNDQPWGLRDLPLTQEDQSCTCRLGKTQEPVKWVKYDENQLRPYKVRFWKEAHRVGVAQIAASLCACARVVGTIRKDAIYMSLGRDSSAVRAHSQVFASTACNACRWVMRANENKPRGREKQNQRTQHHGAPIYRSQLCTEGRAQ